MKEAETAPKFIFIVSQQTRANLNEQEFSKNVIFNEVTIPHARLRETASNV